MVEIFGFRPAGSFQDWVAMRSHRAAKSYKELLKLRSLRDLESTPSLASICPRNPVLVSRLYEGKSNELLRCQVESSVHSSVPEDH